MSRKDVEKALKLCGSPMTYSQFYKKLKLTEEQKKAKANACVHFLLMCLTLTRVGHLLIR